MKAFGYLSRIITHSLLTSTKSDASKRSGCDAYSRRAVRLLSEKLRPGAALLAAEVPGDVLLINPTDAGDTLWAVLATLAKAATPVAGLLDAAVPLAAPPLAAEEGAAGALSGETNASSFLCRLLAGSTATTSSSLLLTLMALSRRRFSAGPDTAAPEAGAEPVAAVDAVVDDDEVEDDVRCITGTTGA